MIEVQQVGGDHYKADYQHWDLVAVDNDVDYLAATATKYIDRYRYKGTPILDLEKAVSYLRKMGGRGVRRACCLEDLGRFLRARQHHPEDAEMLTAVLSIERGTPADIAGVIEELQQKLQEYVTRAA